MFIFPIFCRIAHNYESFGRLCYFIRVVFFPFFLSLLGSSHVVYTFFQWIFLHERTYGIHFTPFDGDTLHFCFACFTTNSMKFSIPFVKRKYVFWLKCDIITRLSDSFIIFILLRILCYVRNFFFPFLYFFLIHTFFLNDKKSIFFGLFCW